MKQKYNLTSMGIPFEDLLAPLTTIVFVLKSGARVSVNTPLSVEDFDTFYTPRKGNVKILIDAKSYAEIDKREVAFYHVFPIKQQS